MKKLSLRISVAFLCFFFIGAAWANPLQLTVSSGRMLGSVDVSLTNTGAEPVSVLLWDTPFEEILSDNVFLIERAAKGFPFMEVSKYIGRSVKRSEPSAEHYQIIQPGEMIVTAVKLNDFYDITQFGEYSVRFAGDIRYEIADGLQGQSKSSFAVVDSINHVEIQSEKVSVSLVPTLTPRLRPPTYDSCSVQERQDIVEAANIAETLTNTAISDLNGLLASERASSPRYNAWFGEFSQNRFNQVVSNLNRIDQALENETLQFNCGCTEAGIFAFVFPALPYSITLCPSFRDANPNGRDSRAGTIIHELSHFTIVANTDDHVYGQTGARALAISNPDRAIANADSYEYFTENAPIVAISESGIVNSPISYSTLQLGVQTEDDVALGQVVTFQVENATTVELTSVTGDADLYVYRDDQLSLEICQSELSTSPVDSCEIFVNGTVYAQVRGFTDATFTLLANGDTRISNDDSSELTLGLPVDGSIAANSRNIYQISGGDIVELNSLTGDADLYIFSGLDLTATSLVCSSTAIPEESTIDSCNIPSAQETYYIAVVGYTDATYSIVGSTVNAEPAGDDPNTQRVSTGLGGIGAVGAYGLVLLIGFVGFRLIRKG